MAVLLWRHGFYIWLSQHVTPGLMFIVAAESSETAGERHGGTALLLHGDVWSWAAADVSLFAHKA